MTTYFYPHPNALPQGAGTAAATNAAPAPAPTLATTPLQPVRRGFDATQGLSALLLAAMVSSLLVVVHPVIDRWASGHLMVAWAALWLVGFAALALFSDAAHKLGSLAAHVFYGWRAQRASKP